MAPLSNGAVVRAEHTVSVVKVTRRLEGQQRSYGCNEATDPVKLRIQEDYGSCEVKDPVCSRKTIAAPRHTIGESEAQGTVGAGAPGEGDPLWATLIARANT